MSEFPVATTSAPGVMAVDWENRVDFERLRQYRLERVRMMLERYDLGAVLLFETSNIRYATATQIGYWAFNKGERWALITRNERPKVWDFGSAAKAHRLQLPHLYDEQNSIGGNTGLQGAIGPETGLHARASGMLRHQPLQMLHQRLQSLALEVDVRAIAADGFLVVLRDDRLSGQHHDRRVPVPRLRPQPLEDRDAGLALRQVEVQEYRVQVGKGIVRHLR